MQKIATAPRPDNLLRAEHWDRYIDCGLTHIHPVIPPGGGPASSWLRWWMSGHGDPQRAMSKDRALGVWAAKVNGKTKGKLPGVWRDDGWQPLNAQGDPARVYDPRVLGGYRWAVEQRGAGIGVAGSALIGLDVDVVEPVAAREVLALVEELLGLKPGSYLHRVGRAPKLLVPFRLASGAAGFPKPSVLKVPGGMVEWLTTGQQWVLEGVHGGTGQPYAWPAGRLWERPGGLLGLPEIDEDRAVGLLRRLARRLGPDQQKIERGRWKPAKEKKQAGQAVAPPSRADLMCDEADAVAMVAAIPNGLGVPREDYVAMAHRLLGASGGAAWGRELFLRWAAQYPDCDPERDEVLWDGLSEAATGWRQLAQLAAAHGWTGGAALRAAQAAKRFSDIPEGE